MEAIFSESIPQIRIKTSAVQNSLRLGGSQTEELVPESKLPLAEIQLPALAQELVKHLFKELSFRKKV